MTVLSEEDRALLVRIHKLFNLIGPYLRLPIFNHRTYDKIQELNKLLCKLLFDEEAQGL